jgi:hypothetical protein
MKKPKNNQKVLIYTLSGLVIVSTLIFSLQIFLPSENKPFTLLDFKAPIKGNFQNDQNYNDIPKSIVISSETESASNKYYQITHNYPKITGMGNLNVQDKINLKIKDFSNFAAIKNNFDQSVGIDIEDADQPWRDNVSYEIKLNNDKLLSIKFSRDSFTGGAYPNSYNQGLNFDLKSGEVVNLKDIFRENSDYLSKIKSIVKVKLTSNGLVDEDHTFLNDGDLGSIFDNFTLNQEGGVTVFIKIYRFDEVMVIKPSEINDILKPEFII